jgi:hypothetical protein
MVNEANASMQSVYVVEEQLILGKTGKEEDCEDALYIGPHFIAVIDGATSKTDRRWNGETGGRAAAHLLKALFDHVPYDATLQQTLDLMTAAIHQFYEDHDAVEAVKAEPVQRLIASVGIISFHHREVWFVGDCQCLLNKTHVFPSLHWDKVTSEARAMFLETEILRGATVEELRHHDTGREFIMPLLERQPLFQNNPDAGEYQYSVVDGFPISLAQVMIQPIADVVETIVLASDGYPVLKDSLEASEQALQEILRDDPLLFRKHKSTKGLKEGYISYDDRTYVKVRLEQQKVIDSLQE